MVKEPPPALPAVVLARHQSEVSQLVAVRNALERDVVVAIYVVALAKSNPAYPKDLESLKT
jgi:hypothetical protein